MYVCMYVCMYVYMYICTYTENLHRVQLYLPYTNVFSNDFPVNLWFHLMDKCHS